GEETDPVDGAFEGAGARPGRADDLVARDALFPAAVELVVRADGVRVWREALGVGDGVLPAVQHPLVQGPDLDLVLVGRSGNGHEPASSLSAGRAVDSPATRWRPGRRRRPGGPRPSRGSRAALAR